MTEAEALALMVPPGQHRPKKPRGGVIQIHVTRACDKACFNCTQASNYAGKTSFISLDHFDKACESLRDYFGIVGVFGGNPALHPEFTELCRILRTHIPHARRGLWCNNPFTKEKAQAMRETFNPAVSNLNVHFDPTAYDLFKKHWPESRPFGLHEDSRHSPVYVAADDLDTTKEQRWELISRCDINQHWSAMIAVFRGELRGYFCEIAGAMSMLKQDDPEWTDTGTPITPDWWKQPMQSYADQVQQHCHKCGVPLKGYGELACSTDGSETTSPFWKDTARPKRKNRPVEVAVTLEELKALSLTRTTNYLQNARNT